VILLDSDILVLDLRFPRDPRFAVNQQTLQQLWADQLPLGITVQALLEVVGKISFNTAQAHITGLPGHLSGQYRLIALPDMQQHPNYAGCTVLEVIGQMTQQMSLGDAVQAVQISRYASQADCLLTWNARHFQGKVVIPVLTPQEWLNQRLGGTP
jgi:hypothetical protein